MFAILGACANPFEMRPVETPDQGGENYVSPTQAHELLENIAIAFDSKDPVLYEKSFQDTLTGGAGFYFIGDAVNSHFLGKWTIEKELSHFSLLVKDFSALKLEYGDYSPQLLGDSVFVRVPYDLTLTNENVKEYYRGEALFKMKYYLSFLVIYGWEDFRSNQTPGDSTWSLLKRYYY